MTKRYKGNRYLFGLSDDEIDSLCERHVSHSSTSDLNEYLVRYKIKQGLFEGIVRV